MTNKKINEATSDSFSGGKYQVPMSLGLRIFSKKDLQPYSIDVSDFDNAELSYDSYDGNMSTPKKLIKKKENFAKKVSLYNKKHPTQSDSDGDVLNNRNVNELREIIKQILILS